MHSGTRVFTRARLGFFIGLILFVVDSLVRALGSSCSLEFAWVHSGATRGLRCSCGFSLAHLGVSGFIRVRVGSLWCAYRSSGFLAFAWVHSGALRNSLVH